MCPADRERGESRVKACRCRVYLRREADDSKCCQPLPLGDQEGDRGKAGFHREDRLSLSPFFLFFFLFCNHALFVSRYKKPCAALAMKRKKPINANSPPASPLHGKNQTPRVHRKSFPRLAPKIIYPRHIRKQYIETYR